MTADRPRPRPVARPAADPRPAPRRPAALRVEALEDRSNPSGAPLHEPTALIAPPLGSARVAAAARQELVIVDSAVADADRLLDGVSARAAADGVALRVERSRGGGAAAVAEILRRYRDLDAVHVVAHATPGRLFLGGEWLTAADLTGPAVAAWGHSLAAGGDLLVYGCDLAAGAGRAFVEELAAATGADVAASTDLTGAAALGGDWDLEFATGRVETAALAGGVWSHTLATATFAQGLSGYAGAADTFIDGNNPTATFGGQNDVFADGGSDSVQGLIRFESIFGNGPAQIPFGATITSASLDVYATNAASATQVSFHRMLSNWTESSSWNSLGAGIQPDGTEAVATADAVFTNTSGDKWRTVTGLAAALQAWSDGAANYGWAFFSNNEKWGFNTSEKNDGKAPRLTVTYTVSPPPVNLPPVPDTDAYAVPEDGALNVPALTGVLANDTDPDGDGLTAVLNSPASHGTVTLNPDGSFTYTPVANYNGADSFTYTVSDGRGGTATATVNLTVTPGNDPPVANDDTYATLLGLQLDILGSGVLANDSDPDGNPLTVTVFAGPANGLLTLAPNGTFVYIPNALFSGTDTFTYTVSDGNGGTATATVTINVGLPANNPPTPVNDSYTTAEDGTLNGGTVLANDTDPDGNPLTPSLLATTTDGTLTFNPDGTFTYVPNADFSGTDTFTYTVSDGNGGTATATVTITVTAANDPPTVTVVPNQTVPEDGTTGPLGFTVGDVESGAGPLVVTATSSNPAVVPDSGIVLDGSGANRTVAINPAADASGTATITITVSDGVTTTTTTFTVTVTPVNDAPQAGDDAAAAAWNTPVVIDARANDADPDGDAFTVTGTGAAQHGTVTTDGTTVTYTPDAGWFGTDTFTYTIDDGNGGTDTATVTVNVARPERAPSAAADVYAARGGPLVVGGAGVLGNDGDPDGDALSAALVGGPAHGTVVLNPDGSFTYTPDAGFRGFDSFDYRAADGRGGFSDPTRVVLFVGPDTDSRSFTTAAGAGFTAGPGLPTGGPAAAVLQTGAAHGTLTVAADGSFGYTPDDGFAGTDSFTYRVMVGGVEVQTVTVAVTVLAADDPAPPPVGDPGLPPADEVSPAPTDEAVPIPTGDAAPAPSDPPAVPPTPDEPPEDPPLGGPAVVVTETGGGATTAITSDPFPTTPVSTTVADPDPGNGGGTARTDGTGGAPGPNNPNDAEPGPARVPEVAAKPGGEQLPPAESKPGPEPAPPQPRSGPSATATAAQAAPPAGTGVAAPAAAPEQPAEPEFEPTVFLAAEVSESLAPAAVTEAVVVSGVVLGAGYVLLNTKAAQWFLSAVLARPAVWRQLDPLEVVYAWEKKRGDAADGEESLQTMVSG